MSRFRLPARIIGSNRPPGLVSRRQIWSLIRRAILLILGALIAAFGYSVFQVPHNLAAGGIGGVSLIINNFTGWPVGTLYFVLNLPLLALGFRQLGRWPFVGRTLITVALFSFLTDIFGAYLPQIIQPFPVTDDLLLNAIYGGILGGIGSGLVYRSGSTIGGTSIIGRLIQHRTGQPLSQSYIYTDGVILLAMGLVFGWTITLYGLLMVFINGLATDYILEGPSSTRVATIITSFPQEMTDALTHSLGRGVTFWTVTGGYTGRSRTMVNCTMIRSQVNEVTRLVAEVDPEAFLTIGISNQVRGKGFTPLVRRV